MNVSLPKKQEQYVKALVKKGRYNSASEVVRTGLRLLEEKERVNELKLKELKRLIQEGIDSGPAAPLDMEEIKATARRQFEERKANPA
ncbi:MAG: type II toxin-antitoxin system ParD family antitoxin [Bacteroidetes bacterium]|nr:type II toxin-antitoxin system ParD family antitoxin [Bacteroidota bacterium]